MSRLAGDQVYGRPRAHRSQVSVGAHGLKNESNERRIVNAIVEYTDIGDLGSLYLYSFIGLVNDVPSERLLMNSLLYCSLYRIQILAYSSKLMDNFITMSGSIHVVQYYNIVRPG